MLPDARGKDMLKKTGYASLPEALDLSSWREFQNGVSLLLDIPLSLYDAAGALLVPSMKESPVCAAVQGCPKGAAQCSEFIASSVAQVVETGNVYVYKCHANQYFFAIPVVVDAKYAFVAVGGHVYLEGSDIKDFYEGITGYGFDGETVSKLRTEVKTIPPKALFTIPSIVNNMAAPVLRAVMSAAEKGVSDASAARLKGFYALEQVYKRLLRHGTYMVLSGVHAQPMNVLVRSGAYERFGTENVCANFREAAVRAWALLDEAPAHHASTAQAESETPH